MLGVEVTSMTRHFAILAGLAAATQLACAVRPLRADETLPPSGPARLEVKLAPIGVPSGELVDWELLMDGVSLAKMGSRKAAQLKWAGTVPSGPHRIGVKIHYRRELKSVVDQSDDGSIGFTFVHGVFAIDDQWPVVALSGRVTRLDASVGDDPNALDDKLRVVAALDNTWVEVRRAEQGRESWETGARSDDPCENGDRNLCTLKAFNKMFGTSPGARH